MDVIVIGGGISGLVAARTLLKRGLSVRVIEREPFLGGMAASFEWDGVRLDRFYHFICRGDARFIQLINELGLSSRLSWRLTSMALNISGRVYPFATPFDLLRLPLLSIGAKIHFGLGIVRSRFKRGWKDIEDVPAEQWLKDQFGDDSFRLIHEPLIARKFGSHAKELSAAWMWARFHRLGRSRAGILQRECLGYLSGGTQTLVDGLVDEIQALGGRIDLGQEVSSIEVIDGQARGVRCKGGDIVPGVVLSTAPLPVLSRLLPASASDLIDRLRSVPYIGVLCVLYRLRRSLSPHYWTNISGPESSLAGIIEYTNLDPKPEFHGDRLAYLPRYLPCDAPLYQEPSEQVAASFFAELQSLYPGLGQEDLVGWRAFRYPYAQPICRTGFTREAIQIRTPVRGLYVTDSCLLHPSDRTLSDTVLLAEEAGASIAEDLPSLSSRL